MSQPPAVVYSGQWAKSLAARGLETQNEQPLLFNGRKNYIKSSGGISTMGWATSGAGVTFGVTMTGANLPEEISYGTAFQLTNVSGTDYVRNRFTIDDVDKGMAGVISLALKTEAGYTSGDNVMELYTNSASDYSGSYTAVTLIGGSLSAASGGGYATATYTADATADYYEFRIKRAAGTKSIYFSSIGMYSAGSSPPLTQTAFVIATDSTTAVAGTPTNITFITENADTQNAWNGTTFTAPFTGYYQCTALITFTGLVAGNVISSRWFDGTTAYNSNANPSDGGAKTTNSTLLFLTKGAAITFQASQNSGANKSLNNSAVEIRLTIALIAVQ